MNIYYHNYLKVLKKNFMLLIMALVLLILTFFIWVGVPFFIIGIIVSDLTSSLILIHLGISLSGGLLFSLYFAPINLKVARRIADIKHRGLIYSFICIETVWILVSALIFEVTLSIVVQ